MGRNEALLGGEFKTSILHCMKIEALHSEGLRPMVCPSIVPGNSSSMSYREINHGAGFLDTSILVAHSPQDHLAIDPRNSPCPPWWPTRAHVYIWG